MSQQTDEEYDGEAWGNDKNARAEKFNSKKKKTRREETRLRTPRKKGRTRIQIFEDLEDYEDMDEYYN